MGNSIQLEVCANSFQSAVEAQKGGAVRVELCDNLREGGTTPSLVQIEITKHLTEIQLNVLIRPRGGDFLYNNDEYEIMKKEIHYCGKTECHGVAIGILNSDGSVDMERNGELVNIAKSYGMSVTFHRAFDRCANLFSSLEDIIKLECDRILTSGGKEKAIDGNDTIKRLIELAGNRIIIMPGGGITTDNISELVKTTNLKEFHGSFQSRLKGGMQYKSPPFENEEEHTIMLTDSKTVRKVLEIANKTIKPIS